MIANGGYAYVARLAVQSPNWFLRLTTDSEQAEGASGVRLYEDGRELGPAFVTRTFANGEAVGSRIGTKTYIFPAAMAVIQQRMGETML